MRRIAPSGRAALALATALALDAPARAADPQPYTVAIAPSGDAAIDAALRDSSNLQTLREAPAGPFALVTRAQEDRDRLASALRSFGYYDGKVQITVAGRASDDPGLPDALDAVPAGQSVPVAISVERGPRFTLRRVEVAGSVPAAARSALQLAPGAPAVAADVLAAQDRLLQALRRQGYALAKVDKPDAVLVEADRALDVTYHVTAGPRVDLGPITVGGLDRVNESYVRRRLLLHPGEQYDPDKIERARQDLAAQGVFNTVRITTPDAVAADGTLPVQVDVTERSRNALGFTASFSTDLGASVGTTYQYRNLFGNAERLDLGAAVTQLGGGSATRSYGYDVTAGLLIPDWLRRDQTLQFNLRGVKEDLDAYSRTAVIEGVTVSRKFWEYWTGSLGAQATQSRVEQEGVSRTYNLVGLPIGLRYDSTGPEGLFEPTHGIKAAATVTPTQNLAQTGSGTGNSFVIAQLSGSTYVNLGAPGRSVVALRGLVGTVQGATTFELPPDQRFYAGGSGTVRGYKYQSVGPRFPSNNPVGGTSLFAGTVEFRQRFGESFGAAVFVDAGGVGSNSSPFGQGGVQAGVGAGVRYYTPIGPIRVDVAVPMNKRPGDDTFELYIGIGQAF